MLSLQNTNGGLREDKDLRERTEGPDWLGLWTYCISTSTLLRVTNQLDNTNKSEPFEQRFEEGLCVSFNGDLEDENDKDIVLVLLPHLVV